MRCRIPCAFQIILYENSIPKGIYRGKVETHRETRKVLEFEWKQEEGVQQIKLEEGIVGLSDQKKEATLMREAESTETEQTDINDILLQSV